MTISDLAPIIACYYFDDDLRAIADELDYATPADFIYDDLHDLMHNANLDQLIDDTHLTDDEYESISDFINDNLFALALSISEMMT